MNKYELVVRKKISQFIEKGFRFFGIDFDHDEYKKIVYGEKGTTVPLYEKLKSFYDACLYLLGNAKSPLTKHIISKFYYILFEEQVEQMILLEMQSKLIELCELSPIEKACEFHMFVYEKLAYLKDMERQLISLMFFNYILVKNNIPAVKLVGRDIGIYVQKREKYHECKEELFLFFKELIKNSFVLETAYLNKLEPITTADICHVVIEMKDQLTSKYGVEAVYLYGSYAKGINRFDSDIDLMVKLSLDLAYDERVVIVEELKKLFFEKFKRFTDIEEVREFFTDDFVREATKIKRIF